MTNVTPDLEGGVLGVAATSETGPAELGDGREGQHLPPLPKPEQWHFFFFPWSGLQGKPKKETNQSVTSIQKPTHLKLRSKRLKSQYLENIRISNDINIS